MVISWCGSFRNTSNLSNKPPQNRLRINRVHAHSLREKDCTQLLVLAYTSDKAPPMTPHPPAVHPVASSFNVVCLAPEGLLPGMLRAIEAVSNGGVLGGPLTVASTSSVHACCALLKARGGCPLLCSTLITSAAHYPSLACASCMHARHTSHAWSISFTTGSCRSAQPSMARAVVCSCRQLLLLPAIQNTVNSSSSCSSRRRSKICTPGSPL
jgi:hypothetical protein